MTSSTSGPVVVLTGANGFVGSHVARALASSGSQVRAIVRRAGTAPRADGIHEEVGDFQDLAFAARVLSGADAAVTTVHPMWSDRETQHSTAVEGTPAFVRVARDSGVERVVHLSTAAVYTRPVGNSDIDEDSPIVDDDAGVYDVTKRDTDLALAQIDGITGFFVRPPAIFGPGETSEFNTIRPSAMQEDAANRRVNPDMGVSWIHVTDLADLVAGLATGRFPQAGDSGSGVVAGTWTSVNAATGRLTARDYVDTVIGALGVAPNWTDEATWTGEIVATRAREWGWAPTVSLDQALAELADGVRLAS